VLMAEETVVVKREGSEEQVSKKVKKRWIPMVASKEFDHVVLGETYVDDPEKAVGKVVRVNLMSLTNDPKKQSMSVTFVVTSVKNNQANTILVGFEVPPAHVRRFTKRSKAKVEDSFVYATADGVKMQIKTVLMVKAKSHHSKLSLIRAEARKFLAEVVKKESFSEVMKSVVVGNMQRDLKSEVKKYHTVVAAMIRVAKKLQ